MLHSPLAARLEMSPAGDKSTPGASFLGGGVIWQGGLVSKPCVAGGVAAPEGAAGCMQEVLLCF